ncbi:MAG: transglutaminase domain-containing protein [Gemmatimonadaceae bacterium]|nr:transglutaminase domain-containing protein [Gemmatimonadaceae bacterium]
MNGRGIAAVAVLAAWGAGLAVFAQRESSRSTVQRLAEAAVRVAPGPTYFAIESEARHVGFASFTTDTIPDGLQFTEYDVREERASGRRVRQVVTHATRALALREIAVSAAAPVATARVLDDSTLLVVRESAAGRDSTRERFVAPLLVPALVPMAIALGPSPSVGDRHAFDVFDPATLRVRRLAVTLAAESTFVVVDSAAFDAEERRWVPAHRDTLTAWRVVEDRVPGLDAWVDALGRLVTLREDAATRQTRTSYEMAFENWRSTVRASGDAVTAPMKTVTAVRATPPVGTLTVVALGLPLGDLSATGRWQRRSGDTIRIVRADSLTQQHGYWLPPQRDHRTAFASTLKVEPGIEVEAHPIAGAARRLRGRAYDPLAVTQRLARWVSDSIRLETTLTPPSALTTLRSASGDADHHTMLFLALARASGIPARAVRGVVYTGDAWLSHSWAEVWVSRDWVPVDPTSGQFPADASHLRLVVGAVSLGQELDRLVSRSTLRVVASGPAPTHKP